MTSARRRVDDRLIGVGLIALGLIAGAAYLRLMQPPALPPGRQHLSPFEGAGIDLWPADAEAATPSPDGEAVLFTRRRNGLASLRFRTVDGSIDRDLTPPAAVRYHSLMYSPDARSIYAVVSAPDDERASLQRQPATGGDARRIVDAVVGAPALSADGTRLAYLIELTDGGSAVQVADAEGRQPRRVLSRAAPATPDDAVAWSPDGTMLIVPGTDDRSLQVIDSGTGAVRGTLFDGLQQFCGVAWSPTGSIVACAAPPGESPRRQLFVAGYPAGDPKGIPVGSGHHRGVRMSADGRLVVSAVNTFGGGASILTVGNPAARLTFGSVSEAAGLPRDPSWRPDGKIVFARGPHIFSHDSDGPAEMAATGGPTEDREPIVTPDGNYLVFEATGDGERVLWRAERATGGLLELHAGPAIDPIVSTEGRWVYWVDESGRVSRVSIDGGTAEVVYAAADRLPVEGASRSSTWPKISPDGRWIAHAATSAAGARYGSLEVTALAGGPARRFAGELDTSLWHTAAWSADGRSFVHAHQREAPRDPPGFGVEFTGKVWAQDVAGGPPRLLVEYSEGPLTGMAASRSLSQVVLIWGGPQLMLAHIRDLSP